MNLAKFRVLRGSETIPKTTSFQPDQLLQQTLWDVNERLRALEEAHAEAAGSAPDPAILFIGYAPRSGSTLLSQLLATTGLWNYISNFQARFWLAPYVGGLLERSLAPRRANDIPLQSIYGLTQSSSSPNEFSYFWEHWFGYASENSHALTTEGWSRVDIEGLRRELRLIGSLSAGPLFFKKDWLALNGEHLLDAFPTARLLHVRRNPLDVALSISSARRDVFGSQTHWWGARPANIDQLTTRPWPAQIAGQIAAIRQAARQCQDRFADRALTLDYEDLTSDTRRTIRRVHDFLGFDGGPLEELPAELARPRRQNTSPDHDPLRRAIEIEGLFTGDNDQP